MRINSTLDFYKSDSPSLFFEKTICESLSDKESPYMEALQYPVTYGEVIGKFIYDFLKKPKILVEIGGGYGSLMKNLIPILNPEKVYMVDINKKFLNIQRNSLKDFPNVEYINEDAFNFLENFKDNIDVFLCNEVIGDFGTMVGVNKNQFNNIYNVDLSYLPDIFNVNIGAIKLIEMIKNKVTFGFISEHSSTYNLPEKFREFLSEERKNFSPRKINLKGHYEYTINFKMLKEIAEKLGFKVIKDHLMNLIPLKNNKLIRFILTSKSHQIESHEFIFEFYNHIKEYEYLILMK